MTEVELPSIAILAGGLGTRLAPLTDGIPKALLPINGRPFIEHQLESLRRGGFRKAVICVGFLGDWIVDCIKDGHRFGISVEYSFDGPALVGTAGAIRQAVPMLGSEFFVIYGDSYLCCDYKAIYQAFSKSKKLALMTVFKNDGLWDSSNVDFSDGKICAYSKQRKTSSMRHIDYGLGVFRDSVFSERSSQTPMDLSLVYEHLLLADQLQAFEVANRFYEIGSFRGIADLSRHLSCMEQTS